MPSIEVPSRLAALIPGVWSAQASNLPRWLAGEDPSVRVTFELVRSEPLMLRHSMLMRLADGRERELGGVDRWVGSRFRTRANRLTRFLWGNWSVIGASDDGSAIALHVFRSVGLPDTSVLLLREDSPITDLRAHVASRCDQFGLSPEEFATLHWR